MTLNRHWQLLDTRGEPEQAYRCLGFIDVGNIICRIRITALILDEDVDLAHFEAGHLDVEIELELRQKLEFVG